MLPAKEGKKETPSVARSVLSATPPDKPGNAPWSPHTHRVRNHLSYFGTYQETVAAAFKTHRTKTKYYAIFQFYIKASFFFSASYILKIFKCILKVFLGSNIIILSEQSPQEQLNSLGNP